MLRTLLLTAALATLAACASTETASTPMPTDRDCFYANSVSGFSMIDDRHVRITAGPSRHYILTTMTDARELDWTQTLALRSRNGWVCTGSNIPDVEIYGGRPVRHYFITAVEREPEPTPQAPPAGS